MSIYIIEAFLEPTLSFKIPFISCSFEFNIDDMSPDVPPSSLVSDLKCLVDNEVLSDVTFLIDGKYVRAHKILLMR